jgi:hypothetical protein
MRRRRRSVLAVMRYLAILTLAGCFHEGQPAPQQPVTTTTPVAVAPAPKPKSDYEVALAAIESFRDRICACHDHDAPCAQAITDEMTKWSQEMAKKAGSKKPDDITPEQTKVISDVAMKMSDCMVRVMTPDTAGNPCAP